MLAVVTLRLLQSHCLGCDCTVNGAWSFKHGILARLTSNSALKNDSRGANKARLLICNLSELLTKRCLRWRRACSSSSRWAFHDQDPASLPSKTQTHNLWSRSGPVDRVSIALCLLPPTPPRNTPNVSERRLMGRWRCLRAASDKRMVSHPDTHWGTEEGWGTGARGDDTDGGEADIQAGEQVCTNTPTGLTPFSAHLFLHKPLHRLRSVSFNAVKTYLGVDQALSLDLKKWKCVTYSSCWLMGQHLNCLLPTAFCLFWRAGSNNYQTSWVLQSRPLHSVSAGGNVGSKLVIFHMILPNS